MLKHIILPIKLFIQLGPFEKFIRFLNFNNFFLIYLLKKCFDI